MSKFSTFFLAIFLVYVSCACDKAPENGDNEKPIEKPDSTQVVVSEVERYVTSIDKSNLFTKKEQSFNKNPNMSPSSIYLDSNVKYQEMDGFGAAVTGSSCYNLLKMTSEDRAALLTEIFDPEKGVGYSYIRISIGCSDFSMDEYTYCDTKGIENFEIHQLDKRDLIPILKEILAINPNIKIMGSPWTCPRWMKVNNLQDMKPYNSWTSGHLSPLYYDDYATYFVKYIKAMESYGIQIESMTIQNEPLNPGNSASLLMYWDEQCDFIKNHLGPAFEKNGIKTKIIVFDHNYNYDNIASQQKYPTKIFDDPQANKYIDGSAWHAYGGSPLELESIHSAHPDKGIYFTEISIGTWSAHSREECFKSDLMWNMREVCLGTINRYCKAVIMWNLMLDDNRGPYRPGGCGTCYGAIDINPSNYKTLTRNSHYYVMAHLSKVIKPGAYRIKSSGHTASGLHYSAFINPDGTYAAVVLNDSNEEMTMTFDDKVKSFSTTVPAKSIASYRWKNN